MKRVTLIPTSTVDHTPFLCLFRHDNRCVGEPESGVRQSGFELLVIKGYNVAYNPSHVRVTKLNMYQHFNPEQSHLTVPFGGQGASFWLLSMIIQCFLRGGLR